MSDAFTDMAREQNRAGYFFEYLQAVKKFLLKPTARNKKAAIQAAEKADSVRGGIFDGYSISSDASVYLNYLKAGELSTWARFLFMVQNSSEFHNFKALSPFIYKTCVLVDYGTGSVKLHGDFQPLIDKLISQDYGWKTYDGDKYFVALDKIDLVESNAFCVNRDVPRLVDDNSTQPEAYDDDPDNW